MTPYRSHQKLVKFAKSRSPISRNKAASTAESYANIVLHYLSKLKSLFHAPERDEKNLESDSLHHISKPILKSEVLRSDHLSDAEYESKQKAVEIVNAALQYGCANNIIEKVGHYFLVKNKSSQRVATRRPTPGPDYVRCASCKSLTRFSSTHRSVAKDKSKYVSKSRRHNSYDDGHGTSTKRKRSRAYISSVNYCPKCYARMKSNKKYS